MLCALAFLLPNDIVQGFEDLVDLIKANHNNNVEDLLEYFEENYISRYRRNAPQHIAIIPIELWIMFNRTDEELPRIIMLKDGTEVSKGISRLFTLFFFGNFFKSYKTKRV